MGFEVFGSALLQSRSDQAPYYVVALLGNGRRLVATSVTERVPTNRGSAAAQRLWQGYVCWPTDLIVAIVFP